VQLVYVPFHVVSYNFNGQNYNCVVNAVTGEVSGDRSYGTGVVGEILTSGWKFITNLFSRKHYYWSHYYISFTNTIELTGTIQVQYQSKTRIEHKVAMKGELKQELTDFMQLQ